MPIYEYRCSACGHEMDHFHRTRSAPAPACRSCGADALEKLVSLTSFQLKGDGWYVTDYKSKGTASTDGKADDTGSASASRSNGAEGSGAETASDTDKKATDSGSDGTPSTASQSTVTTASSASHAA